VAEGAHAVVSDLGLCPIVTYHSSRHDRRIIHFFVGVQFLSHSTTSSLKSVFDFAQFYFSIPVKDLPSLLAA
jgi:hypothetical protein